MSHKHPTQYYDIAKHIALSIPDPVDQVEVIENAMLEIERATEEKCPRACARHFSDLMLKLARLDGYECDFCKVEEQVLRKEKSNETDEPNAKGVEEAPSTSNTTQSEVS